MSRCLIITAACQRRRLIPQRSTFKSTFAPSSHSTPRVSCRRSYISHSPHSPVLRCCGAVYVAVSCLLSEDSKQALPGISEIMRFNLLITICFPVVLWASIGLAADCFQERSPHDTGAGGQVAQQLRQDNYFERVCSNDKVKSSKKLKINIKNDKTTLT